MIGFRCWYADGSTYEGATLVDWKAAPDGIVQLFKYGEGFKARYKGDWYFMRDDDLHVVSPTDWGEEWAARPAISCLDCVKKGAAVTDDEYAAIEAAGQASTWP